MDEWKLVYDSYQPEQEDLREALCVLGNGYFAARGAGEESEDDDVHYPGTYLAGGYNRLTSRVKGQTIENEDLVNFSNWLPLNFRVNDGKWFDLSDVEILFYRQELDIHEGVLKRDIRFRDAEGQETVLTSSRIVSMRDPHRAAIQMTIRAENWNGDLEVLSALDGRIKNNGVARYRQLNSQHLEPVEACPFSEEGIYLKVRTVQSNIYMAQAARTRLYLDGKDPDGMVAGDYVEEGYTAKRFKVNVRKGQTLRVEKVVGLYTSRDKAVSESGLEARNSAMRAGSFDDIYTAHKLAWEHLWKRFDIRICVRDSQQDVSRISRLHIFHLLQTTSVNSLDLDIGVPPRGWHGEAYRGHILWDELFVFSTLNLQLPELTRALLLYRYRRLPAARRAARDAGYCGAMFPWQSGSDGREESQKIHLNPKSGRWIPDHTRLQRHVSSAIAYNVWQHYEATEDAEFLAFYGGELILEIARFWAGIAAYNSQKDRYEIRGVMGPDEYHDAYPDAQQPGLNNSTYTNIMAAWVFARAIQVLEAVPQDRKEEMQETLGLSEEEVQEWQRIRTKLFIPFHEDGVISQFEGYEQLKELDWDRYRIQYDDIQRLDRILEAEGDSPNHYKASKQADVLMLFYLFSAEELRAVFQDLGYDLTKETIEKTVKYYLRRTSHGSTLSSLVHSWVLARSDRKASWDLFCTALKSDVSDVQGGTTPEGIHLGAMAGTVDLLQRCYTGLEFRGNVLRFNPRLPEELDHLETEIRYRGHTLLLKITRDKLTVRSKRAAVKPIRIAYCDQEYTLHEGQQEEIELG